MAFTRSRSSMRSASATVAARPSGVGDVITGGEQVAGVQTISDGKIGFAGGEMANHTQILEAASDLRAGSHGIFEQYRSGRARGIHGRLRRGRARMRPGLLRATGPCSCRDAAIRYSAPMVGGAVQLAAKCRDGFFADQRIERGQIHEVIDVDGERREIEASRARRAGV